MSHSILIYKNHKLKKYPLWQIYAKLDTCNKFGYCINKRFYKAFLPVENERINNTLYKCKNGSHT